MEKVKKTKAKESTNTRKVIQDAFIKYVLTEGKLPTSVYKFCLDNGWQEGEFYQYFANLETIPAGIWEDWMNDTLQSLRSDENFASFSSREKILTFYFAFAEKLKQNRSYALYTLKHDFKVGTKPAFLLKTKKPFTNWLQEVMMDGLVKEEIAKRPFLDKRYPDLFWGHYLLFLQYWQKDMSPNLESTDVFIEKSVNLAFDLISKGAVDSAFDFAKFLFQQRRFSN
jgi:hypothetical protein